MANPSPDLSIVIPVYNEEDNLAPLLEELLPVLEAQDRTFEILFIDDGSRDASSSILKLFIDDDVRLRLVRFSRNYGQQMANTAGLRYARGGTIIIMDADLQTPPCDIPRFLEALNDGYDIVYGVRERVKTAAHRKLGTNFAVWLINTLTGFQIPDSASGYLALDRKLVADVNRFNERSRYLSGLFAWLSYGRFTSIQVSRRPRLHGESKYDLKSLVLLVVNFVTLFSVVPLQLPILIGILGAGISLLSFLTTLGAIAIQSTHAEPLALTTTLLILASTQLFFIGIAGAYLGRVYGEVRENPQYVVRAMMEQPAEVAQA